MIYFCKKNVSTFTNQEIPMKLKKKKIIQIWARS